MPFARAASRIVFPSSVKTSFPSIVKLIISFPYRSTQGYHAYSVATQTTGGLFYRHIRCIAILHLGEAPPSFQRIKHGQVRLVQPADYADVLLFIVNTQRCKEVAEVFVQGGLHLASF